NLDFTAELVGTGADGADFAGSPILPASLSGTIPAGAASAVVTLTVQGDVVPEGNEGCTVTLKSATAAQSGVTASLGTTGTVA
ncbi:hypothetical protein, partial [Escherichia ruysiae]|uniref:hypothetical protein n=1 Tax=Escherichia ruysiae TaxID=2608867 RepID=UPI00215A9B96